MQQGLFTSSYCLVLLAIALSALNILSSYTTYKHRSVSVLPADVTDSGTSAYTYVAEDFPEFLPLPHYDPVGLVVEDSDHYLIYSPDARDRWAADSPAGFGYLRLGPEHRAFALSMFHELHCIRLLRAGLAGDHRPMAEGHFFHCLDYLRQTILCTPDLTLEPPDVLTRDFDVRRVDSVHVCHDWRKVYDAMETNWMDWVDARQALFDLPSRAETQESG